MPETADHWTLDRKVPVVLIVTIVVQIGGTIWYAAKLDGRVTNNEVAITVLQAEDAASTQRRAAAMDRLTRLEAQFATSSAETARRLDRIEAKVDSLPTAIAEAINNRSR